MKLTLSWLKDHLDTDASLAETVERLTSRPIEVSPPGDVLSSEATAVFYVSTTFPWGSE